MLCLNVIDNPEPYDVLLARRERLLQGVAQGCRHLQLLNTAPGMSGGIHWVVCVWDDCTSQRRLRLIDPMPQPTCPGDDYIGPLATAFRQKGWNVTTEWAAFQADGWRCGYFSLWMVCVLAQSAIAGGDPFLEVPDCMPDMFPQLCWRLLEQRDTDPTQQLVYRGKDALWNAKIVRMPADIDEAEDSDDLLEDPRNYDLELDDKPPGDVASIVSNASFEGEVDPRDDSRDELMEEDIREINSDMDNMDNDAPIDY